MYMYLCSVCVHVYVSLEFVNEMRMRRDVLTSILTVNKIVCIIFVCACMYACRQLRSKPNQHILCLSDYKIVNDGGCGSGYGYF